MRAFRHAERGYALITAIVVSVLYFGLIQLMLMESSRELAEARRFRARIVALTLAENAIELAAAGLIQGPAAPQKLSNGDGEMTAETVAKPSPGTDGPFAFKGSGESSGTVRQSATAQIRGRIDKGQIIIEWSQHSQ
jgi:hypothetical protein